MKAIIMRIVMCLIVLISVDAAKMNLRSASRSRIERLLAVIDSKAKELDEQTKKDGSKSDALTQSHSDKMKARR